MQKIWTVQESKMSNIYKISSLVAQTVKNLPVMQETWVQSLGWEDPLEKGIATHSGILAWRIPWIEERPWWATVHRVTESYPICTSIYNIEKEFTYALSPPS